MNLQSRGYLAKLTQAQGAHWTLADQAIVSGTNFLTGVLVARVLGIEKFGVFSLAWLAVLFAQSIQQALIASPMLSIGPKQRAEDSRNYYGLMTIEQIIYSVIAASASLVFVALGGSLGFDQAHGLPVALAAVVFTTQIQDFLRRYNFSLGNSRIVCWSDFLRCGTQLVGLGLLFSRDSEATVANVLFVISAAAVLGVFACLGSRPHIPSSLSGFRLLLSRQVSFSKWMIGSALMQWTTGNFLVISAGAVLGPVAVGALKAAQNLLGVTHVFFHACDNLIPPRASKIFHDLGFGSLRTYLQSSFVFVIAATGAACALFALFPEFWLSMVFGESYQGYGYVVRTFAIFYLLMACIMPFKYAFIAIEETKPLFVGQVFATMVTLALAYPLIHNWQLVGVLTGLVVVQVITLLNLSWHYMAVSKKFGVAHL